MDEILAGGLLRGRCFLISGGPGVGKTTFGLQFLLEGARAGERVLYLGLGVSKKDLLQLCRSHRWSLDNVALHVEDDGASAPPARQTIFSNVEVALAERLAALREAIDRVSPSRVVLDAVGALRLLAREPASFHLEMQRLKRQLKENCVMLLLDAGSDAAAGGYLEEMADGAIAMEQRARGYGGVHRRLQIKKIHGGLFRDGHHDYRIITGGLVVYPRLIARHYRRERPHETVSTGLPALDDALGGGLDRGASLLLLGPTGTGKSSIAARIAGDAARRGEKVVMYLFDESLHTTLVRADGLGMSLRPHIKTGRVGVTVLEPGEWTLGEFADSIRRVVEDDGASVVVIDSLRGCRHAMLDEPFVTQQLREIVSYLREQAVIAVLVAPQQSGLSSVGDSDADLGYLEDTLLLFRRYERAGEARTGLTVLKRHAQPHRRILWDLALGPPAGISLTPLAALAPASADPAGHRA